MSPPDKELEAATERLRAGWRFYDCGIDGVRLFAQDREKLISALTAEREAHAKTREELATSQGAWNVLANIADTCRARRFEDGPTDERVIAMVHSLEAKVTALTEALEQIRAMGPVSREYSDGEYQYGVDTAFAECADIADTALGKKPEVKP